MARSKRRANAACPLETESRPAEVLRSADSINPATSGDWKYLGGVDAVGADEAPSLDALRTDAYLLSFPTGAQLSLINTVVGPDGTVLPAPNDPVLTETANLLDQYNVLANEYNSDRVMRQCHWEALETALQDKLLALDKTLEMVVDQPGSSRRNALQALRNGLREVGTLRGLKTDWRYWEMLGVSPAEFEHAAKDATCLSAWRKKGFSAREALSFRNAGYAPEQVRHLKRTGITGPFAKQLIQRGYTAAFFEETLGKRASLAEAALFLQDHHDVTATEKAAYQDGTGRPAPDVVFMPGVMMEKAEETYRLYPRAELAKPDTGSDAGAELCRNMTWLKLLDQISGQIDRHEDNMRITAEGKVKGIDNDQCWPTATGTSNHFGFLFEGLNWTLTDEKTGYPRVVDATMVVGLCGFSDQELRQWRAGRISPFAMGIATSRADKTLAQAVRGCITRAEMQAGQRRLHALQAYLLGGTVKVISDWKTEYAAAAKS